MYSADSLSKMAEQKRRNIQRSEAQGRLAKDCQHTAPRFSMNIIRKVWRFMQSLTKHAKENLSQKRTLENMESTSSQKSLTNIV